MFARASLTLMLAAGCVPEDEDGRPSIVPEWAEEIAPNTYLIGPDFDPLTGEEVEGWLFVDQVDDGSDRTASLAKGGKPGAAKCWATLGAAGWTAPEPWGFDPTNSSGIADLDIQTTIETAHATWEAVPAVDIFGTYSAANTQVAVTALDGENNLRFADTGNSTTVAYAQVWSPVGGRPNTRHIYEWDIVMQDMGSKVFTVSAEAGYFDLENIAVHELGHALGLGHPPNTCTEETMYAFVAIDETKKRDLNAGDIDGVNDLY